jgi:threonine synthase
MRFRSTKSDESSASFKDAVLHCLPPEGGLYVPDQSVDIRQFFLNMDANTAFSELVATVAPSLLQGELNSFSASRVAESAFHFEPELIRLDDHFSVLNLYKGPTGLFKDFGIAFLAAVMEELLKDSGQSLVLAAARCDTGVSMANAFSGRKGIRAVLVYPSGQIHGLDTAAFAPNGGNIIPIQIQGTFDVCQRLINETINDRKFAERYGVTSANAINPGRLLPQIFYYLYAFIKIKKLLSGDLLFSVPCGNFGNLIAGLYAWKFGMPVSGFIAAMNANNTLGDFIRDKPYIPHPLINTNSPALDVATPSNFERLASFYKEAPAVMHNMVYPASIDDECTLRTIAYVWEHYRIFIDPQTAVAFAAARQIASGGEWECQSHTVILATGHPARETALIRAATGQDIPVPETLLALRKNSDPIALIPAQLDAFENAIASCL